MYDYDRGISAVDVLFEREQLNAVHIVLEQERAAIVDTGTANGVGRVLEALAEKGVAPEQVDYVILTHVHLDHAGGAGQLMARCPNATLTVHPRGARHMIDPSRLLAATVAVYGEQATRRMVGEVLPVPADRVRETPEGASVSLAGRELAFLDAPGHARHHVLVRDTASGGIFVGDSFGLSYRELDRDGLQFSFPTTSPAQFDPPALQRTIDRILALGPPALYVTHFGRLRDLRRLAADLHRLIDAHVEIAERHRNDGAERGARLRQAIDELVLAEGARQRWKLSEEELRGVFALDIELNAQGLEAWLEETTRNVAR
ncbi:MAG TPA: MBL fold metallo-hydrolase [Burkholderiales bacterium]|nr:MBL fold metallo-hydrolase [Burkholderiales bacterium]